jgi:hypothetical protein
MESPTELTFIIACGLLLDETAIALFVGVPIAIYGEQEKHEKAKYQ